MSTVNTRNSLIRSIAVGGIVVAVLTAIDLFMVAWLVFQAPPLEVAQFWASGWLGEAAFAGGYATALMGVISHLGVSTVIAGIFILSASRLATLQRHAILGGILYGVAVYFVMNLIVLPLSAAPPPGEVDTPLYVLVIEGVIGHILTVGLPLGIIVRRTLSVQEPVAATA